MMHVSVCKDKPFEWVGDELFIAVPAAIVFKSPSGAACCWIPSDMAERIRLDKQAIEDDEPNIFIIARGAAGTTVYRVEFAITYAGGDVLTLLVDIKEDTH